MVRIKNTAKRSFLATLSFLSILLGFSFFKIPHEEKSLDQKVTDVFGISYAKADVPAFVEIDPSHCTGAGPDGDPGAEGDTGACDSACASDGGCEGSDGTSGSDACGESTGGCGE